MLAIYSKHTRLILSQKSFQFKWKFFISIDVNSIRYKITRHQWLDFVAVVRMWKEIWTERQHTKMLINQHLIDESLCWRLNSIRFTHNSFIFLLTCLDNWSFALCRQIWCWLQKESKFAPSSQNLSSTFESLDEVLKKTLSIRSVVSTASSFAERINQARFCFVDCVIDSVHKILNIVDEQSITIAVEDEVSEILWRIRLII